jgi:AcrR family transcriptional regulator
MGENKTDPARYVWKEQLQEALRGRVTDKQIAVLITAAELFSAKGYAATTTREIARLSDVSEGALFKYFATKEELFASLTRLIMDTILFPMISYGLDALAEEAFPDLESFLRALFLNRTAIAAHNTVPFRVILHELPYRLELREEFGEFLRRIPLVNVLNALKARGVIKNLPVEELLHIMITCIIGFFFSRIIVLPEYFASRREQDTESLIQFMARGLAP